MKSRSILRAATLIAVLCLLPATALATGQQPDVLIYNGKTYDLFANPLEAFYKDEKKRPLFFVEPNVMSTGNWLSAASERWEKTSDPVIIAGKGWGKVCLGVDLKTAESVLGKGENRSTYSDVYFKDYPAKGIQISYNNSDDTIHAIFFYNGQRRYERFVTLPVRTDNGINWKSSPEDVIKAYGKTKEDYQGEGWRRIAFEGIDFRFENGVMVRIGILGN